jgi:hypothetical protein
MAAGVHEHHLRRGRHMGGQHGGGLGTLQGQQRAVLEALDRRLRRPAWAMMA